jgi:hypothetical protein
MTRIWNKRKTSTENMVERGKQYYECGTKEITMFRVWKEGTTEFCSEIA